MDERTLLIGGVGLDSNNLTFGFLFERILVFLLSLLINLHFVW